MPAPITLRGRPLAQGRLPAICAPLVGRTREQLLAETAAVTALAPDLLEWRVDFFEGIGETAEVLATAHALRAAAGGIPLLFTRRSQREGGQPIGLGEAGVAALYEAVCSSGTVDLVDWEMDSDPALLARVQAAARAAGLPLVLSFHDFQRTPEDAVLAERFQRARQLGGDIAKLAVMPHTMADVLRLLAATLAASEQGRIPVISMAMGPLGAVSRTCGGAFGSALTFAVGASASAPGQMPVAEVRQAVAALQRAMGVTASS
jgi:3-dehydroquinate dehydratase-1